MEYDTTPNFIYNVALMSTPLLLFVVGLIGMLWYRYDIIRLYIALEIMILAANLFFVQISFMYTDIAIASQIVVPIVLAIAACEAAVGLGLLVVAYRARGTIEFSALNKLKG